MKHFSKLTASLISVLLGGACIASPSISPNCVKTYHAAIEEANHGEPERALATLHCLLMPHGITVGLGAPGAMSGSVSKSVSVWGERLEDSPFLFSSSSNPDLRVEFVPSIKRGGDVQGEVHCQRQVYWGSQGSRYRVTGTIQIRDNVDGRRLTHTEISSVIEHELGHVLGLEDDSDTSHLMGPFVPGHPVDGPGMDEVDTVRSFRIAVADVVRQVGGRSSELTSRGVGMRGHRPLAQVGRNQG